MTPQTFQKKPVRVQAMHLDPGTDNWKDVCDWIAGAGQQVNAAEGTVYIPTLEGTMAAQPGDWIIRGVQGEFYPCKPDIFDATYELVVGEP